MKARALKEVWNFAAVLPLDKGPTSPFGLQERHSLHHAITNDSINQHPFTNELLPEDFLAICSQQFLSQGANLLKRTRKGCISLSRHLSISNFNVYFCISGALHWKNVSFCINSANKVELPLVELSLTRARVFQRLTRFLCLLLQVVLKMKSRYAAGTIAKKKKCKYEKFWEISSFNRLLLFIR